MVVPSMWIRRRFFLAASMPLRMAEGTSLALPTPKPTTLAAGSPITTSAEKLRFLPPFTTLVTRLIETTCSFRLSVCGSIRFTVLNAIRLKLQSGFPCRVRQGLDAAVVDIAAPIEHYLLNSLFLGSPGNDLADGLGRRQVATLGAVSLFDGGSGNQREAVGIVDYLHIDIGQAAEHRQTRPLRGAAHLVADALVNALADLVFLSFMDHYFAPAPVLPSFLRNGSPV